MSSVYTSGAETPTTINTMLICEMGGRYTHVIPAFGRLKQEDHRFQRDSSCFPINERQIGTGSAGRPVCFTFRTRRLLTSGPGWKPPLSRKHGCLLSRPDMKICPEEFSSLSSASLTVKCGQLSGRWPPRQLSLGPQGGSKEQL